jgi:small subunit ribosomal protein S1
MLSYRPEGMNTPAPGIELLGHSAGTGDIFEAVCTKCDAHHNLHIRIQGGAGIIPRQEASLGHREGGTKEYALLARVGKSVCFQVLDTAPDGSMVLSRRAAQAEARDYFLHTLQPGDVVDAVVLNAAEFGVFCDIGCGFPALMRIDRCCISRLQHTGQIYHAGQTLRAAVFSIDDGLGQVNLTGRELLGTWDENASLFHAGETVPGIVRSIMPYGAFIELTPNLSGLAEAIPGLQIGDGVSVYIRSILPDRHKIKLNIIERLANPVLRDPVIFSDTGHIRSWEYYPGSKAVTVF